MRYSKILFFAVLALVLVFTGCSQQEQSNLTSSAMTADTTSFSVKDGETPSTALSTATVSVTLRGINGLLGSFTVEIWQNGIKRATRQVSLGYTGYKTEYFYGMPTGCGYIANAWQNGIGIESHTWPSKCVSGSTHLGCLQFNTAGVPVPWQGSCP